MLPPSSNSSLQVLCKENWYIGLGVKWLSQNKEQDGFIVSKCLTLPSTPPWAGQVLWWSPPFPQKVEKYNKQTDFRISNIR